MLEFPLVSLLSGKIGSYHFWWENRKKNGSINIPVYGSAISPADSVPRAIHRFINILDGSTVEVRMKTRVDHIKLLL